MQNDDNGQEPEDHGFGQPDRANLCLGHGRRGAQPHQAHTPFTPKGFSFTFTMNAVI